MIAFSCVQLEQITTCIIINIPSAHYYGSMCGEKARHGPPYLIYAVTVALLAITISPLLHDCKILLACLSCLVIGEMPEISLRKLRNELYRVRIKWYDIGVELNVATEELDIIKSRSDDPAVCLREMIALRLRSSNELTWRIISDALRTEAINETALADGSKSDQS